jgi:hypothetical protein
MKRMEAVSRKTIEISRVSTLRSPKNRKTTEKARQNQKQSILYRISQSKSHGADAKDRPKNKSRQDIKQTDGVLTAAVANHRGEVSIGGKRN